MPNIPLGGGVGTPPDVRYGSPGDAGGGGAAQSVPSAPSPQTPGAPAGGQLQPQAASGQPGALPEIEAMPNVPLGGGVRTSPHVRYGSLGDAGGGGAAQAVPSPPSPQTPGAPAGGQLPPQAAAQVASGQPGALSGIECGGSQPLTSGSITDSEKRKMVKQQLALLLHAHKCRRLESQSNGAAWKCTLPHCKTMKEVIVHMTTCQAGKDCSVPHCPSSKQIINHWKHCNKSDCLICSTLKQPVRTRTNNVNAEAEAATHSTATVGTSTVDNTDPIGAVNSGSTTPAPVAPTAPAPLNTQGEGIACPTSSTDVLSQQQNPTQQNQPDLQQQQHLMGDETLRLPGGPITANPVSGTKEWHQSIPADLRNHLVQKLVRAIFPTTNPAAMLDKRMHNLIAYAKRVESDMYEMANTKNEYYHLMADKTSHILKELEKKREKRKEHQLRAQQHQQNQLQQQQQQANDMSEGEVTAEVMPPVANSDGGSSGSTTPPQPALPEMRIPSPGMNIDMPTNRMSSESNLVDPPGPSPNQMPPAPNSGTVGVGNPGVSSFHQTMTSPPTP